MTSVYSLRSSTLGYRVTKFTDGEPEGSYHTSHAECDCPAGSRPSCRHRQMLPRMLTANLLDSPAFWNHDRNQTCDIDGRAMALPKGPEIDPAWQCSKCGAKADERFDCCEVHEATKPAQPWRRI